MRITYLDVTSVESGFDFSQISRMENRKYENRFPYSTFVRMESLYTSDIQISNTHLCCFTSVGPFNSAGGKFNTQPGRGKFNTHSHGQV